MSFKFFISLLIIYYTKIREINSLNYHIDSRIRSHIIIFFYYYNMIFRLIFMVVFGIISCALKITIGRRGRGGGDCTLLVLDLIFVVSCNRISSSLLFSKEFNNYIIHNNRRFWVFIIITKSRVKSHSYSEIILIYIALQFNGCNSHLAKNRKSDGSYP